MAARHFAKDVPDEWFADDSLDDAPLCFGRHCKEPALPTHTPAPAATVLDESDPDAAARRYIEQLMLELDPARQRESEPVADEPAAEPEPVVEAGVPALPEDEPTPEEAAPEVPDEKSPQEGGLESTLVLDRDAVRAAHDERLAEQVRRERLEVSTNVAERRPEPVSLAPVEPPRRFGFFATIGEFVSRLLHLDDR